MYTVYSHYIKDGMYTLYSHDRMYNQWNVESLLVVSIVMGHMAHFLILQ